IVDREVRGLPAALRADLGLVRLETAELPALADLIAEEPPLSPTILGLFRGAPLAEARSRMSSKNPASPVNASCDDSELPRTLLVSRRSLLRAVPSREELVTQVRTTLLHELGHLRGEDDETLRARGLE